MFELYAMRALALRDERRYSTHQSRLTSLTRPWFCWDDVYQEASCKYYHNEIPDENCECGLYAHFSINYFIENGYRFPLFLTECGGRIIIHKNGVIRCQSQKLSAIIATPWNTMEDINYISEYYNIPIICESEASGIIKQSIKHNGIDYEWESDIDEINKRTI